MEYQYITFLRANMISQGMHDEYGVCPICESIKEIRTNVSGCEISNSYDPHKCSCGAIIRRIHKQISFYDIEEYCPLIYDKIKHHMPVDIYLQKARVHTERPRRDNEIIVFEKTIHSQGLYDLYYVCVCGEIDKTHQRTHLWCDSCRSLIKLTDKDVCFHYEYEIYKEFGFECLADKPDFLKEHYPHKVYYAPYVAIVRPDEDSN